MSHLRLAFVALWLIAPAVAGAVDGGVYLYLQPLPPEATTLTFAVTSVSAVSVGGSETALKLSLASIGFPDAAGQRLLASGRVPAGSYGGFVLRIKQAALKDRQGETALAVPDTPVRLDVPFATAGQQESVFWLTLKYDESVTDQSSFSPLFSILTPPRPIASRAGFVTNSESDTITVFDKSLSQTVAVLGTCAGPSGMALDQLGRRLYVACSKDDEIRSIDVATGELLQRSRTSPGDRPREIALTPDGATLVSANSGSNSITFFDAASLTRRERTNVGNGPGSILIDPTGRRAFVFNALGSSISVVDIPSRSVAATVPTDAAPLRGRFNARGDRLYVIHARSPYITVLDPGQLSVLNRARLRIGAGAIEVDNVRNLLCIGGSNDPMVEFYDPNALMPLYSMRTGGGASYLRIDAEENILYVVSADARRVLVGRLADRKVASEIDVGDGPYSVAVMGEK